LYVRINTVSYGIRQQVLVDCALTCTYVLPTFVTYVLYVRLNTVSYGIRQQVMGI